MNGGPVQKFARLIVAGACRGEPYVKYPSWYDIFLVYRVFSPKILNWTFRLLLSPNGSRRTSFVGTGRPVTPEKPFLEGTPTSSPRRLLTFSPLSPPRQLKQEWVYILWIMWLCGCVCVSVCLIKGNEVRLCFLDWLFGWLVMWKDFVWSIYMWLWTQ